MEPVAQILIVDDEKNIRKVLAAALAARGYPTESVGSAEEAVRACEQTAFDLVLLDIRLPGPMNGDRLLIEIHTRWPRMVIIMLTAYASLDSAISTLRRGAHDYLIKPARLEEILQSVESGLAKKREEEKRDRVITSLEEALFTLKQARPPAPLKSTTDDRFVQTARLTIDRQKRLVVCDGKPLVLSPTEFDVLEYLARHADRVVTASELVKAIQGYVLAEVDARPLVRVHIQHLREKLEDDPEHPHYILNVRGRGYRFISGLD